MKASLYSSNGTKKGTVELPNQFDEPVRNDLIHRAFLAIRANKRQRYGTMPHAGERVSAKLSRRRRKYKTAYGRAMSRVPRKTLWKRGRQFGWVGAYAPGMYKGRKAHPPKATKILSQKINIKENRKAIRSALSASVNENFVKERGHFFKEVPIIFDEDFYDLKKTKDLYKLLIILGFEEEINRIKIKKVRAGKGKNRGRRYNYKKGPLFVLGKSNKVLSKILSSIQGTEAVLANNLNVDLLAPGGMPGRLTFFTKDAVELIKNKNLFTEHVVHEEKKLLEKDNTKETKKEEKIKKIMKAKK
ncbi:50S ribosomal protein L4 [Candidatus Woesearchaeota archaeon]|nr:50S ribosomal protein L4 [Candidatus Woesearchaeota archaeon]